MTSMAEQHVAYLTGAHSNARTRRVRLAERDVYMSQADFAHLTTSLVAGPSTAPFDRARVRPVVRAERGPLRLSDVTLVAIDNVNVERSIRAMEISMRRIRFGAARLLTGLPTIYQHAVPMPLLRSIEDYSSFCARDLHGYIPTSHCLMVQHDGWVLNPDAWDWSWMNYDYVGCEAGWTGPGEDGKGGNAGFCLRSKRLLEAVSGLGGDPHPEDVYMSMYKRDELESKGMRFAPRHVQRAFGVEIGMWVGAFGHHQGDLSAWKDST